MLIILTLKLLKNGENNLMVLDLPGVPQTLFKHSADFGQGFEKRNVRTATVVVASDGTGDFEDIQEGINELPQGGGIVIIKRGTYEITSPIVISKDSITIQGVGHSTIIKSSSSVAHLLSFGANVDYCVIEDIQFDGTNVTASLVAFSGATSRSRVSGCWFDNWSPQAITFLSAGEGIIIENCTFETENTAVWNYAIIINASSYVTIRGNFIRGGSNIYGIQIYTGTSQHITIVDNFITNSFVPISVIGTNGTCEQVIISNNLILTSTYAIYLQNTDDNQIVGNQINAATVGVYFVSTNNYNNVSSNLIANCTHGVYLTNAAAVQNTIIVGNQSDGNTNDIVDYGTNTQIAHNIF